MGTNFYTFENFCANCDRQDRLEHIGKRSAAGLYCWSCDAPLPEDEEKCIHCGTRWERKGPGEPGNAAGVELGFAEPAMERPHNGVTNASAFRWAMEPDRVRLLCEASMDAPCVVDEYGSKMTGREFLEMLRCQCPLERFSIGVEFS